MGNFSRGGFGNRSSGRDSFRDNRDRGRSGGSYGRSSNRRPVEMHDATCDKCKRECQVPFRPTGDKPVLCSDCFRKNEGSSSSFSSRDNSSSSGISKEQFNQINTKLDKILGVLQDLEIDTDDDSEFEDDEDEEDEDEDEEDKDEVIKIV
jgi:CxxC-x17-CxxC domain-containing protein